MAGGPGGLRGGSRLWTPAWRGSGLIQNGFSALERTFQIIKVTEKTATLLTLSKHTRKNLHRATKGGNNCLTRATAVGYITFYGSEKKSTSTAQSY